MQTGFDYSWFILTQKIIAKEFARSGSEQNPDLTGKSWGQVVGRVTGGIPGPIKAFMDKGEDFIVERDLSALVKRMNALVGGEPLLSLENVIMTATGQFATGQHTLGRGDAAGPAEPLGVVWHLPVIVPPTAYRPVPI